MLITYIRSSSYNSYDFCPHSFFISYGVGIKQPTNPRTEIGSISHKAIELLARKKLALQNNETKFRDEELNKEFGVELSPDEAIEIAYDFYSTKSEHKFTEEDRETCEKHVWDVLLFNGGEFSPLKRKILAPEQYFDIEIRKPWAYYKYGDLEGYLRLKGTIDLVTEDESGVIHYVDWKTGRRWDWAHDAVKTYDKLQNDFQLLLYYYALRHLYPDAKLIIITIYFIKDGGPFTMCFDEHDLLRLEKRVEKHFTTVKNMTRPKLRVTWKCKSFCGFYKKKWENSGKNICEFFRDEIVTLGMDRVTAKYGDINKITNYGEGGGRTHDSGAN